MNWLKNLNPVKNTDINLNQKKSFNGIKGKIHFSEPLSKHTTLKIGGPARIFIEPYNLNDLKLLLRKTKKDKIPVKVIG